MRGTEAVVRDVNNIILINNILLRQTKSKIIILVLYDCVVNKNEKNNNRK